MTAVSFTVLIMAGTAQAQMKQQRDCRWDPNRPLMQNRHLNQNDCMVMRQGPDVGTTGSVAPIEVRRVGSGRMIRSGTAVPAPAAARSMARGAVAQAPAMQRPDCRYEPNFPIAAPYWVDQNGCLRMRRGNEDVFVTGTVDRAPTGTPVGRVGAGTGNGPSGGMGQPPAGGVSPVANAPRGSTGNTPQGEAPKGNTPQGEAPKADTPKGDNPKGDNPKGDNPRVGDGPGNPGNDKPVGGAGESPNGRDFGDGTKGRSDVEGRGGNNGNRGDHGNRGDSGNNGNNGFGNGGQDGSNAGKQDSTR
jgi:hypothetical protein